MSLSTDQLKEMLILQDNLNSKINPHWKEERTESDFETAVLTEVAELIESLPWKWWKKQDPNLDNVKIELVDIWHFMLSDLILSIRDIDRAANFLNENFNHKMMFEYTEKIYFPVIAHVKAFLKEYLNKDIPEAYHIFGTLVNSLIGKEKFYYLYIGKNILNKIRQELGYNSGDYNKYINGKEDNEILLEAIENVNSIDELENKLRNILRGRA